MATPHKIVFNCQFSVVRNDELKIEAFDAPPEIGQSQPP
jgi:hypothetical protein